MYTGCSVSIIQFVYIHPLIRTSLHLSIHPLVHSFVQLSFHPFVFPSMHSSIHPMIHLKYIYILFIHLSTDRTFLNPCIRSFIRQTILIMLALFLFTMPDRTSMERFAPISVLARGTVTYLIPSALRIHSFVFHDSPLLGKHVKRRLFINLLSGRITGNEPVTVTVRRAGRHASTHENSILGPFTKSLQALTEKDTASVH